MKTTAEIMVWIEGELGKINDAQEKCQKKFLERIRDLKEGGDFSECMKRCSAKRAVLADLLDFLSG